MYNFPFDKGVSVGDAPNQATGTIVRNCLIYGCLSGVMAKDECVVTVYNCTIVDNSWGFTNYSKVNPAGADGGGHTIAWNNIVWGNDTTLSLWNAGTLTASNNVLGNTNWPGPGNIDVDPLFQNPAIRDYRLSPSSPCWYAGVNGEPMGATLPVGGLPTEPISVFIYTNESRLLLSWDNGPSIGATGFVIEASTNSVDWFVIGTAPKDSPGAYIDPPVLSGIHFRVKATNFIGSSFPSMVASIPGPLIDNDGDGMADSWEDAYGFNRNDPTDAALDTDSDGQSNLAEFRASTDPRNPVSRLAITSIVERNGRVAITFTAQPLIWYELHYRDSLSSGGWQRLHLLPPESNARVFGFDYGIPPNAPNRFYRLVIP